MITEAQKNIIIDKLHPFRPKRIGIFGSYARGEQTSESDLDILVDFEQTVNLLDIIGLEMELSELLDIKVDLITSKSVHPRLAPHINSDIQPIYYAEK